MVQCEHLYANVIIYEVEVGEFTNKCIKEKNTSSKIYWLFYELKQKY